MRHHAPRNIGDPIQSLVTEQQNEPEYRLGHYIQDPINHHLEQKRRISKETHQDRECPVHVKADVRKKNAREMTFACLEVKVRKETMHEIRRTASHEQNVSMKTLQQTCPIIKQRSLPKINQLADLLNSDLISKGWNRWTLSIDLPVNVGQKFPWWLNREV